MKGKPNHDDFTPLNPLVPVAQMPETVQPTVDIPDERRIPLSQLGTKRAKNSPGKVKHHIRGILGEFAVAKYFGVPEKIDTRIYDGGDPGYDLQVGDKTIDVKTVGPRPNNPCLMVAAWQELCADFYVLVQELSPHAYRIIGYAPAIVVANADIRPISSIPHLDQYADRVRVVEQYDLFPIPQSIGVSTPLRRP